MKSNFSFLIAVLFIAACSQQVQTQKPTVKQLAETDIYQADVVSAFASSVPDSVKEDSKKVFLNAIDLYRNKKSPEKAIAQFKNAILKYPEAKSYYEMGNALMDVKNYKEAIQSYHMAEKLDYNPIASVLYNLACAYSLSENGEEALKYVQLAIENGYSNTKQLLTDTDLDFARKMPEFSEVYEDAMSGASSPEAALFDLYAVSFPQSTLPVEMSAEQTQSIRLVSSIAYEFESFVTEMVNPNFSREVGDEFYYLAMISETEKYTAVIYAGRQVMYEEPPVYHILATYDNNGKLIDKVEVGGYHYYTDPMRGYIIDEQMNLTVNEYEVVFQNNTDEFGYENNPMTASELLNTRKFKIQESGKIKQTSGDPIAWFSGF